RLLERLLGQPSADRLPTPLRPGRSPEPILPLLLARILRISCIPCIPLHVPFGAVVGERITEEHLLVLGIIRLPPAEGIEIARSPPGAALGRALQPLPLPRARLIARPPPRARDIAVELLTFQGRVGHIVGQMSIAPLPLPLVAPPQPPDQGVQL